jgi:dihydropteroate synthase
MIFDYRGGSWDLEERVRLVGILNVTPDSFSDGGRYSAPDAAIARAEAMVAEGADAVDVGAESTRPGTGAPLSAEEEWARLSPVVAPLAARLPVPLSIDTYHAETARRALDQGAGIVNDVSGLTHEPALAEHAARAGAGLVLMHAIGVPGSMHAPREYVDVAQEVTDFLGRQMRLAVERGVPERRIALDPGIGFSKRAEQSFLALRGLPLLTRLGRPVYIGVSRKSFLGTLAGRGVDERLAAGLGVTIAAIALGARIVRTHDVRETADAIRAAEALLHPDPALKTADTTRG